MKKNTFIILFKLLAITVILVCFYGIWKGKKLDEKFEKTKLNISPEELIFDWGQPDEEFDVNLSYDKRHIIKYDNLLFGQSYIFAIKSGEKNISEKYFDD